MSSVAASLIASAPRIVRRLGERHVCVLLDPDTPRDVEQTAAALAATLGLQSARRHVLVRFSRAPAAAAEALRLEPMGVTAMISMVFPGAHQQFRCEFGRPEGQQPAPAQCERTKPE